MFDFMVRAAGGCHAALRGLFVVVLSILHVALANAEGLLGCAKTAGVGMISAVYNNYFLRTLGWIYYHLVTLPLHTFYFIGPVWGNLEPSQICFELTEVDSAWWNATADRRQECASLLAKHYGSFEATVLCSVYFAIVLYLIFYFVFRCCFVRPFVSEARKLVALARRPATPAIKE